MIFVAQIVFEFGQRVLKSVKTSALRTEPPAVAADDPSVQSTQSGSTRIFLQAGAFANSAGAERLRRDLRGVVGDDVHVQQPPSGDRWYRVRIGPLAAMSEALRLQALIVAAAFSKPLIVEE